MKVFTLGREFIHLPQSRGWRWGVERHGWGTRGSPGLLGRLQGTLTERLTRAMHFIKRLSAVIRLKHTEAFAVRLESASVTPPPRSADLRVLAWPVRGGAGGRD